MHEDEVLFTEFFNQRLKERGYTLKHLADETGIAMKHLESFSSGRFERLPSAPYVRGYFVRLGGILGFDPNEWWSRIKEEDMVHKAGSKDKLPGNRFSRIRGKALLWGVVGLALVALYIGARYTTILGEPQLTLIAPPGDLSTVSTGVVMFQGTVRNGDTVSIDGNSVPVQPDGSFSAEVALAPGPNTIEIRAGKTLGRTVAVKRQIYYSEAAPVLLPAAPASSTPSSSGSGV